VRDRLVRRERVVEAIREILSELLLTEMKDPRLHGVVISAVDLSGDLKLATAFFSVIGDAERERQALDGLHQAKGVLRHEMARRMRMHNPPDLQFRRDKGFERADRVSRLLHQIAVEHPESAGAGEVEPDQDPAAMDSPAPTPDLGPRTPGKVRRRG
jgi:ribosome-binding factor A